MDEGCILVCRECDALHRLESRLRPGHIVLCSRCQALLHKFMHPNAREHCLALHLAALMLFALANFFPFLTLKISGREATDMFVSATTALFSIGNMDIAVLVLLTSVVFPLLTMLGALYLLIPAQFGHQAPAAGMVFRLVHRITPWSMLGVFMLGVIIAIVKLLDMADMEFGIALFAFLALLPVYVLAQQGFRASLFWPVQQDIPGHGRRCPPGRACDHGLVVCHTCGWLMPAQETPVRCPRCTDIVHARKPNSTARTWALLITGIMLFIPANVFPIMTVIQLGDGEPNTIFGGVVHLIEAGMWPLGLIVFFASIIVPISKFVVILFLLLSVRHGSGWRAQDRTRLYRVTESIGSWSMVDIFVIGLLASLVHFGNIIQIRPEIAASFFAATVVVTMFAAQSFDPRLIWDRLDEQPQPDRALQEQGVG
ncbi:MAG: PqiA/YebS family transporter subunit [Zetaproteobacteria bacterium]|nr:MAG: PqiA/YebS family transporter subunit [Zetaproteobacteria bacterium]